MVAAPHACRTVAHPWLVGQSQRQVTMSRAQQTRLITAHACAKVETCVTRAYGCNSGCTMPRRTRRAFGHFQRVEEIQCDLVIPLSTVANQAQAHVCASTTHLLEQRRTQNSLYPLYLMCFVFKLFLSHACAHTVRGHHCADQPHANSLNVWRAGTSCVVCQLCPFES